MTTVSHGDGATRILDAAEAMIRVKGFNGFSFREIAKDVGVKSSTVHYYYPTKADLGVAVTRRYSERFLTTLGDPTDAPGDADAVLDAFRRPFRDALSGARRMCLCGMLGAEIGDLPPEVAIETARFFERATAWLVAALSRTSWGERTAPETVRRLALRSLATLEGALILARALDDATLFDAIALDRLDPASHAP